MAKAFEECTLMTSRYQAVSKIDIQRFFSLLWKTRFGLEVMASRSSVLQPSKRRVFRVAAMGLEAGMET